MNVLLYVLVGIVINAFVGACVWVAIDDENQSYYKWYCSAPNALFSFLTLELWPVGLAIHLFYNQEK